MKNSKKGRTLSNTAWSINIIPKRNIFVALVPTLVYLYIMQFNIDEAKTTFSALVERAIAGERVVIARNGSALLSLEPIKERSKPRTPGLSTGKGTISEDFDTELTEE